jgi:hypothetical protein
MKIHPNSYSYYAMPINQLSDEDLAAIVNPGWGTRRHIHPR